MNKKPRPLKLVIDGASFVVSEESEHDADGVPQAVQTWSFSSLQALLRQRGEFDERLPTEDRATLDAAAEALAIASGE